MADGTVRGTFDLNVRPAIRGVREYRREAARADAQTKQLGGSIDRAFGERQVASIDRVARSTGELGVTTARVRREVRDEWRGMRRDIEREGAQISSTIAVVRDRLRALGRERATPTIDVDGITRALAQVETLHERLNSLGRQRATPRVAMGGGFAGNRVGGAFGGAASRARAGARAGGGMFIGGGPAMAAASRGGGGGGGGSGILSMGGIGFAGLQGGTLAAVAAGALPAVQALAGATTALAGSLSGAALGAGAMGLAGGGVLAAGIAAVMSIAKPAQTELTNAWKAQTKYNEAVADFGRRSKQAVAAKREMDQAFGRERGVRRTVREASAFGRDWRRLTAPGRQDYFGLLGDVTQVGRRAAPGMAADANVAMSATRTQGVRFARTLAGPETQRTLEIFTRTFARELPTAERTLENVTLTVEHLGRAALPFFHEANVWVRNWTGGLRTSTADIDGTRRKMEPLVAETRDWFRLTRSTFHVIRDLFTLGAPAGDSMVRDLTRQMDRWDEWIKRNPAEVRSFFRDTVQSTKEMAGALKGVVHWLNQMATLLRPLLDRFSQLVTVASGLGLIGAPGAAAALLGGFRGGRGGLRGRGGGGAVSATGAASTAAIMSAPAGAERAAGGMFIAGGGLAAGRRVIATPAPYEWQRRQRLMQRRIDAGLSPTRGGAVLSEGWLSPRGSSATAARVRAAGGTLAESRVGRTVAGGARGAVRGGGPIVLGLSALQAAGTPGTFGERLQAAESTASFGLVPMPVTGDEARQRGQAAAADVMERLGPARSTADMRAQIATLRQRRARALAGSHTQQRGGLLGTLDAVNPLSPTPGGPSQEQARRNAAAAETYAKGIRALQQAEEDLHGARKRELNDLSRQRAQQYGSQLGGAFSAYRRAGQTTVEAAGNVRSQVREHLGRMKDAGVETLGEASLAWARGLAKGHPEMKKVVDQMTTDIENRFKRMGKSVHIVNGDILTGSKTEWAGIRDAMAGPIEAARQRLDDDFTAIQQKAVGSLRSMGFGPNEARSIVQGLESGAPRSARAAARQSQTLGPGHYSTAQQTGVETARGRARGGLIPGRGLMDTVPTPDGGLAAPGEAWIANRHTMSDLSRATVAYWGKTAEQMIRGEHRRHGMPARYALGGGIQRRGTSMGQLSDVNSAVRNVVETTLGQFPGLSVTSTTGGRHARNSLHYRHAAVDIGGSPALMNRAAGWIGRTFGASLTEGIHNPNLSVKDGRTVDPSLWGSAVWQQHANHIHVGLLGGRGAQGGAVPLASGGSIGHVNVAGLGLQQPGLAGTMRQRAGDIYAAGLERGINRAVASRTGGDLSGFSGGGDSKTNLRLGRRMMRAAGFGGSEWPALRELWTLESGWNQMARNPTSGAFGIPQALPASKMGSAAVGGDAAAQIAWGLGYIRDRYGSPSSALSFHKSHNWYGRGGRLDWGGAFDRGGSFVTNGPTAFVAGEGPARRRERVTVTPARAGQGAGGVNVTFAPGSVVVQLGHARGEHGDADIDAMAEKVGERVARKITEAIRKGTAGVVD